MYIPSETESEGREMAEKKTIVKNVRHFLNRTWKHNKQTMKHELEKLQEELETDEYPKFFYSKKPGEDPYMIYRGLMSEMPANTPKSIPLPPNTLHDPDKQGLKLDDTAINYYRGDYPLFFPFYGEEVSAIGRTNFTDPVTSDPFEVGSYIVQFTNGSEETFMRRTSLIKYWNRPYPTHPPDERAHFFFEKLKNPVTSAPFHDYQAKFVKVVQITAAQIEESKRILHENRAQMVQNVGNVALNTGKTVGNVALATGQTVGDVALNSGKAIGNAALATGKTVGNFALGTTGRAAKAAGLVPLAASYLADATTAVANKTGLSTVAAVADYASLASRGLARGMNNLGNAAVSTANGTRKSPRTSPHKENEKEKEKEPEKSWFDRFFA